MTHARMKEIAERLDMVLDASGADLIDKWRIVLAVLAEKEAKVRVHRPDQSFQCRTVRETVFRELGL